jgi:ribosomal protein S18 acetylase RimI-like enzyme
MSTLPLQIRAGVASDTLSITELLAELNRFEGYDRSATPEEMADILFHHEGRVQLRALVAEVEGAVVGMLLYYWGFDTVTASFGYHLADIVVSNNKQGRGVGRALYTHLARQCLREGAYWISLTVLKKNTEAKKFYRAMGMVEVAVDFYAIGPNSLAQLVA